MEGRNATQHSIAIVNPHDRRLAPFTHVAPDSAAKSTYDPSRITHMSAATLHARLVRSVKYACAQSG